MRGVGSHQHGLLPERRVPSWLSVATSLQCPPWRSSELGSGLLLSQPLAPGPLFLWAVGLCEDEVGGVPKPGPLLPTRSPGEKRGRGEAASLAPFPVSPPSPDLGLHRGHPGTWQMLSESEQICPKPAGPRSLRSRVKVSVSGTGVVSFPGLLRHSPADWAV